MLQGVPMKSQSSGLGEHFPSHSCMTFTSQHTCLLHRIHWRRTSRIVNLCSAYCIVIPPCRECWLHMKQDMLTTPNTCVYQHSVIIIWVTNPRLSRCLSDEQLTESLSAWRTADCAFDYYVSYWKMIMVTPSLSCYPHSVSLPPMFLSSLIPRPRILLPTCDTESQSMLRLVLDLGPRLVSFLPVLLYTLASVVTSTATFLWGALQ